MLIAFVSYKLTFFADSFESDAVGGTKDLWKLEKAGRSRKTGAGG